MIALSEWRLQPDVYMYRLIVVSFVTLIVIIQGIISGSDMYYYAIIIRRELNEQSKQSTRFCRFFSLRKSHRAKNRHLGQAQISRQIRLSDLIFFSWPIIDARHWETGTLNLGKPKNRNLAISLDLQSV